MFNVKQRKLTDFPEFLVFLKEFQEVKAKIEEHSALFKGLSTEKNITDIQSKLDSLILWKGQVTELAIGITPTGKTKVNKFGKKLFGRG